MAALIIICTQSAAVDFDDAPSLGVFFLIDLFIKSKMCPYILIFVYCCKRVEKCADDLV